MFVRRKQENLEDLDEQGRAEERTQEVEDNEEGLKENTEAKTARWKEYHDSRPFVDYTYTEI